MTKNEYNLFCISSSEENEIFFQNSLPRNLDLKEGRWEIGMTGFGLQFNNDILCGETSQPSLVILKNATPTRKLAYADVLQIWRPTVDIENLTLRKIAESLDAFLDKWIDGNLIRVEKSGGYAFEIQSRRAEKTSLLIHQDLVRLFGFQNLNITRTLQTSDDTDAFKNRNEGRFLGASYFLTQISKNQKIKGKERKNIDRSLRPFSITVSTDIVTETPDSDKYSTLVYDTALTKSLKENNNYFYHYVKNIKYYPVRNTDVQTIRLEIFDIYGQKLALKKNESRPSFANFHLRKMSQTAAYRPTNYIRIDSENSAEKTATADFWVYLKDTVHLEDETKLALVDITFPHTICNVKKSLSEQPFQVFVYNPSSGEEVKNDFQSFEFHIPAGYYPTENHLIYAFNRQLPEELKNVLQFSNRNHYLKIKTTKEEGFKIIVRIPQDFQTLLGLIFNLTVAGNGTAGFIVAKGKPFVGSHPMDIMRDYPGVMLCHTNFVEHSIVGNSFLPVLKIVPTQSSSKNDYISTHFDNLEFVKPNRNALKELHFQFKDLSGQFIEFDEREKKKIILNFAVRM